ncbi:MAG: CubicO group peptidase (beta-lactamase class C family) [Saprospiraceae bacterium]|jgi:CubicO group peptidase (beta-lactamase class C family)
MKMMNRILVICIAALLITGQTLQGQINFTVNPAGAGMSEQALDRYEAFLKSEIEAKKIPGAVSLIMRKGQIAHSDAYGYSNISTQEPMTTDKIFYIQSMTKPIISIAFMTLYEEGKFFLTDPVSKYIPEFANLKVIQVTPNKEGETPTIDYVPVKTPVQIWHLLSHTAGFSHGLGQNEYDQNLAKALYGDFLNPDSEPNAGHKTIQDRVNALVSYPLMGQPGEQWNYSAAPDVLCVLIEQFTGQTPAEFLQERIFDPLGMNDTGYNVTKANENRIASLHAVGEDGQLAYMPPWGPSRGNTIYGGTHGLFSTATDYMTFAAMLLNNGKYNGHRIIGRKTLELMTDNHIEGLPYSPGNGFGLGFGVRTDVSDSKISGSEGIFHWGGAFNTYFFVDQEEEMVAVLMTQLFPYTNHYASKLRQFTYSAIDD